MASTARRHRSSSSSASSFPFSVLPDNSPGDGDDEAADCRLPPSLLRSNSLPQPATIEKPPLPGIRRRRHRRHQRRKPDHEQIHPPPLATLPGSLSPLQTLEEEGGLPLLSPPPPPPPPPFLLSNGREAQSVPRSTRDSLSPRVESSFFEGIGSVSGLADSLKLPGSQFAVPRSEKDPPKRPVSEEGSNPKGGNKGKIHRSSLPENNGAYVSCLAPDASDSANSSRLSGSRLVNSCSNGDLPKRPILEESIPKGGTEGKNPSSLLENNGTRVSCFIPTPPNASNSANSLKLSGSRFMNSRSDEDPPKRPVSEESIPKGENKGNNLSSLLENNGAQVGYLSPPDASDLVNSLKLSGSQFAISHPKEDPLSLPSSRVHPPKQPVSEELIPKGGNKGNNPSYTIENNGAQASYLTPNASDSAVAANFRSAENALSLSSSRVHPSEQPILEESKISKRGNKGNNPSSTLENNGAKVSHLTPDVTDSALIMFSRAAENPLNLASLRVYPSEQSISQESIFIGGSKGKGPLPVPENGGFYSQDALSNRFTPDASDLATTPKLSGSQLSSGRSDVECYVHSSGYREMDKFEGEGLQFFREDFKLLDPREPGFSFIREERQESMVRSENEFSQEKDLTPTSPPDSWKKENSFIGGEDEVTPSPKAPKISTTLHTGTPQLLDWQQLMEKNFTCPEIVNTSPFQYFFGEVIRDGTSSSMSSAETDKKRQHVYNTMFHVPWRCELLIDVGFFVCLDSFLSLFTVLPIRMMLFTRKMFSNRRQFQRPSAEELSDLGCFLVLIAGVILLQQTDISYLYHMIRSQSTIKLYVIFNVLEIFDKLCQSFGSDVLQVLFNSAEGLAACSNDHRLILEALRFTLDQCIATISFIVHSLIILMQSITLSAAIRSHNNALLTLLVSNNFAEIKSNVFKRLGKDNLHKLAYLDTVERFHIVAHLFFVLVQNLLAADEPWFYIFALNAGMVLVCEILVDSIKHAFLAKFNELKPVTYSDFLQALCRQTLSSRSHEVHKTMDFVPLSPACVVIRVMIPLYAAYLPRTPVWWRYMSIVLFATFTYAVLVAMKITVGLGLQKFSRWYVDRCLRKGKHLHVD